MALLFRISFAKMPRPLGVNVRLDRVGVGQKLSRPSRRRIADFQLPDPLIQVAA